MSETDRSNTPNSMANNASHTDDLSAESQTTSYKTSLTAIRKARRFALQGLYEWHISSNPIHDIEAHTRANNAMHTVHLGYYHELMHEIVKDIDTLDALIASKADREMDKLDGVERAVLRIGAYELKNRLEIPFKVVLDEAIQLNAHFGSVDGHKYINAVLDKLAKELRKVEVDAHAKANAGKASQKNATQKPPAQSKTQPKSQSKTKPKSKDKPQPTVIRKAKASQSAVQPTAGQPTAGQPTAEQQTPTTDKKG